MYIYICIYICILHIYIYIYTHMELFRSSSVQGTRIGASTRCAARVCTPNTEHAFLSAESLG